MSEFINNDLFIRRRMEAEHLDHPTLAGFQIHIEADQQIFLQSGSRNHIRNR